MSQGAYGKSRLFDLESYLSDAGYEAVGPGGEVVMKYYMCARFIDADNGGHGVYWRVRDCGITDEELRVAQQAAAAHGFDAMDIKQIYLHMLKTGNFHLTTPPVTKEVGEEIIKVHKDNPTNGAGEACVWFRVDPMATLTPGSRAYLDRDLLSSGRDVDMLHTAPRRTMVQ